jgi:hypothetical protein
LENALIWFFEFAVRPVRVGPLFRMVDGELVDDGLFEVGRLRYCGNAAFGFDFVVVFIIAV